MINPWPAEQITCHSVLNYYFICNNVLLNEFDLINQLKDKIFF